MKVMTLRRVGSKVLLCKKPVRPVKEIIIQRAVALLKSSMCWEGSHESVVLWDFPDVGLEPVPQ